MCGNPSKTSRERRMLCTTVIFPLNDEKRQECHMFGRFGRDKAQGACLSARF